MKLNEAPIPVKTGTTNEPNRLYFFCLESVADTVTALRRGFKIRCRFLAFLFSCLCGSCSMIQIEKHSEKGYVLTTQQHVNRSREEVFGFFSDATQLERITPPLLNFKIQTPLPIELNQGTLIDYSLKIRFVPIKWRTEISVWETPNRFVDRQLRGPYKLWNHEHTFEEVDGGTMVYDRVHYVVPGGPIIHSLFVKNDLIRIFEYRRSQIELLLNDSAEPIKVGSLAV